MSCRLADVSGVGRSSKNKRSIKPGAQDTQGPQIRLLACGGRNGIHWVFLSPTTSEFIQSGTLRPVHNLSRVGRRCGSLGVQGNIPGILGGTRMLSKPLEVSRIAIGHADRLASRLVMARLSLGIAHPGLHQTGA